MPSCFKLPTPTCQGSLFSKLANQKLGGVLRCLLSLIILSLFFFPLNLPLVPLVTAIAKADTNVTSIQILSSVIFAASFPILKTRDFLGFIFGC